MYKRILLKLSGEALGNPFDTKVLENIAEQIKQLVNDGVEVGIVVGGGNICRGRTFEKLGLDRRNADYIGMEATVINAQMIEASLTKIGVNAKTLSTIDVQRVEKYDTEKANILLDKKTICVFGGGTGEPFFSTDTASALRAQDIHAEVILMAKNGVDGVYNADPKKDPTATRFEHLTYMDLLNKGLQVMDSTATSMCMDNDMELVVFNMNEKGNIVKAMKGEAVCTRINKEEK